MRNPHAGRPIEPEVTDAEIAAALEDASVPTLLMACVHLSEDEAQRRTILDGPVRPAGLFLNEYQGFMPPEDQAAGRKLALEVIRGWRDRGCPEPEPLPVATLHEMMTWLACDTVGAEYVPMMLEELALDGRDSRAPEPVAGAEDYPVVIIGCGMSGLLAAIRLAQAGFPFVVIEKNDGPGGTWFENTYPGRPRRRRQPLLLLQLRARRPLDRVLLPAARAAGLLRAGRRRAGDPRPRAVRDRGHVARRTTRRPAPGPCTSPTARR